MPGRHRDPGGPRQVGAREVQRLAVVDRQRRGLLEEVRREVCPYPHARHSTTRDETDGFCKSQGVARSRSSSPRPISRTVSRSTAPPPYVATGPAGLPRSRRSRRCRCERSGAGGGEDQRPGHPHRRPRHAASRAPGPLGPVDEVVRPLDLEHLERRVTRAPVGDRVADREPRASGPRPGGRPAGRRGTSRSTAGGGTTRRAPCRAARPTARPRSTPAARSRCRSMTGSARGSTWSPGSGSRRAVTARLRAAGGVGGCCHLLTGPTRPTGRPLGGDMARMGHRGWPCGPHRAESGQTGPAFSVLFGL